MAVAPAQEKGFTWRRPRHTLKGRQRDPAAVAAGRQRLAELKRRAAAGGIDLVFVDESEALTHPYLARCWAERGCDLRVQAPGQAAKRRAPLGACGTRCAAGCSCAPARPSARPTPSPYSTTSGPPTRAGRRTRPPGRGGRQNGPSHASRLTTAALAERPRLAVDRLPAYAPELNEIEYRWRDLERRHHLANRTFAGGDDLERVIHHAVDRLSRGRRSHSSACLGTAA